MSNYLDQDDEPFSDRTDEMNEVDPAFAETPGNAPQAPPPTPRRASGRPIAPPQNVEEQVEEEVRSEDDDDEDDVSTVLSDARLRLEQGRLYEMIMNHSLFEGMDADAKAIKNVEREIKKFARQRMEIMLGMRQEAPKEQGMSLENFPFNSLEVEALKALAAAATQGASRDAEPFNAAPQQPKRQTLNTIGGGTPKKSAPQAPAKPLANKPAAPVKRQKVDSAIQRILDEEGVTMDEINEVFDPNHKPLDPKKFQEMTAEEILERNRQVGKRTMKPAHNPSALPMPPQEQIEAIYSTRAQQAAANPQMQMIMGLLNNKKK